MHEPKIPANIQKLFNQAESPLLLLDRDGRCVRANAAALDFFGYEREALESLSIWELSHQDPTAWKEQWKGIWETRIQESTATVRRENGDQISAMVFAMAIESDQGRWVQLSLREADEIKDILGCKPCVSNPAHHAFKHLDEGVALHEMILDDEGQAVDYRFLEVNHAFCTLLGLDRQGVLGRRVLDVLPKTPRDLIKKYGQVAQERQAETFTHHSEDLGRYWKVRAYSPEPGQFVTIFSDITDLILKQQELEVERERLQMAIDTAHLGFLDIQMERKVVHVHGGVFAQEGIETVDQLNQFFLEIHEEDKARVARNRQRLLDGDVEEWTSEMRLLIKGQETWVELNVKTISKCPDGRANRMIGVIRDIDERKREQQQCEFLASHDILTQTYNRNAFESYIRRSLPEEEYPLGMVLFDVDGLKILNDGFGHGEGDLLLTYFAQVLKKEYPTPARIFRIGGDEFAVILPQADPGNIEASQATIKSQVEAFDLPIQASISSGYGMITCKDVLLEDVFQIAEDYMYREKLWEKRKERGSMADTLIKSLQTRTQEDYAHFTRLENWAMQMAQALELGEQEKQVLRKLAFAHDIGKLATPQDILYKPGALTAEEWIEMRKHSEIGYRLAMGLNDLSLAASDILLHHERWDGGGYPQGLKGEDIPLTARVIALVDAYDAMIHDRCYRKALTPSQARVELQRGAGSQFDPTLVDLFIKLV